jgi:hypothetical protein
MKYSLGLLAILPALAGCGFAIGAGGGVVHETVYYEAPAYASYGGVQFDVGLGSRASYRRLPVPRGAIPPPGRCRIWLPGVAPGHQPRRGPCNRLQRRTPPGAWLLYTPRDVRGLVELIYVDAYRPGVKTRYVYDVRSGRPVNEY